MVIKAILVIAVALLGGVIGEYVNRINSTEYPRTREVSKAEDFLILLIVFSAEVAMVVAIIKTIVETPSPL